MRATWIAGIKQEKAEPYGLALRVLPPLLYGEGHPYAIPFSGAGNEQSIASLTRDDLLGYQRQWLHPAGATLIVVGDTTLAEIVPLLEKHFGDWKGQGTAAPGHADRQRRPAQGAARVPDRPARRGPGEHLRRPAGAVDHGSRGAARSTSPTPCSAASSPRA